MPPSTGPAGEAEGAAERFAAIAADRAAESPMHAMAATHALLSALPAGGALVDEAITTGFYVRMLYRSSTPGSYYFTRGGGLGWGVPAALGVKLARPDSPSCASSATARSCIRSRRCGRRPTRTSRS